MFATRVLSYIAVAFVAVSGIANAMPTAEVEKRQSAAAIRNAVANLERNTAPILSRISTLVDRNQDTDATIEPLINQLENEFDIAQSSVSRLQSREFVEARQADSEVARTAANVIQNTVTTLDKVKKHGKVKSFPIIVIELDIKIEALLLTLGVVLKGVLGLVGGLLVGVGGLLKGLGLGLVIGILGI